MQQSQRLGNLLFGRSRVPGEYVSRPVRVTECAWYRSARHVAFGIGNTMASHHRWSCAKHEVIAQNILTTM